MDINERRNFRSKVLQIHYEISTGNLWTGVLRPDVATKLGIEDYNDDELLNAIKYLEGKDFLQVGSNVDDRITVAGVDEVESGYPTLGSPDTARNEEERVLLLLSEIDKADGLARKGLLRQSELTSLNQQATDLLTDVLDMNTDLGREYDKSRKQTVWTQESHTGYVTDIGTLNQQRKFLNDYLESMGSKPVKKEVYIHKGAFFTGRQYLRNILKGAKTSIAIQDNYIEDPEFLNILEPYVTTNIKLQIRILTQNVSKTFKSDLLLFKKQFNNVETKLNKDCHDRFIIIDGQTIYHSGHSFKDLGGKASAITQLEDSEEIKKVLQEYDNWWTNGTDVV